MEEEKKDREMENHGPPGGGDVHPPKDEGANHPEGESPSTGGKDRKKRGRISWKRSAVQCEEELARTRAELGETKERLLRRIAEFENFRRRVEEEKQLLREEAKAWAFGEVLHLFDMLDMALAAAEKGGSVEDLVRGLRMVQDQWKNLLGSAGVEEVPGQGNPFDPLYHDAVQVHRTEEVPPGMVTNVLRKGYRMKNRVLRHAQVVVSGKPAPVEKKKETEGKNEANQEGLDSQRKEGNPPPEPKDREEPESPGPQED